MSNKKIDHQAIQQDIKSGLEEVEKLEKDRHFGVALDKIAQLVKKHPQVLAVDTKFAKLLEICKEYEKALIVYRNIHEKIQKSGGKSDISIVIGITNCQIKLEKLEQAEKLLEELRAIVPKYGPVYTGLSEIQQRRQNLDEAEKLARKAYKLSPDDRPTVHQLASVLTEKKQNTEALKLLEKNIRRRDLYGDSIDLWLKTLDEQNRNRYAQEALEELMKIHPNSVEFAFGYAVLANRAGEISLARPAYEKSMELSPNNSRIMYELGILERSAGNLERSHALIGESLKLRPDSPAAIRTYNSDLKLAYGDENFKRLNYVAAKFTDFTKHEQVHLHYALAKAYEDVDDLETAFRHYLVAGEKKRVDEEYNDRAARDMKELIKKVVTQKRLDETKQVGCDSELPVFILGMPRSGTSLMEQILSAHPDIFGAGELKILTGVLENIAVAQNRVQMNEKDPVFTYDENASWEKRGKHYVERLQKLASHSNYKRIIDKMPGNYNFVGLIQAILPKSRIIHSRRHPVETCLSCYRIHFAEGHQWTYNQRELGRFYRYYWDLMKFWREEFPSAMYEVRYEDNVADVEASARKLIEFLGLEWNENCLNFYNVDRPVMTASVTQVRKPIYKTSTNRWRKYEKYLGPLLEELGDIVPEYEKEIADLS